jgi:hypothetical protein
VLIAHATSQGVTRFGALGGLIATSTTMVLGENGVAFATDGTAVAAFDVNGKIGWFYKAPSQDVVSIIAAAAGNGLVAKLTDPNGVETVLRIDPNGVATTDNWTASAIDYFIGDEWTGFPGSGGSLTAYSAAPVQLSTSVWFAPNMNGTRQAVQNVNVTNFSKTGPNQDTITSVLQKIQAALPSNTTCSNWLQGSGINQGRSGLQQIQDVLSGNFFGHGTVNLGATPYYNNAAFTGSLNPDGKPVPGLPSSPAPIFTVNDIGAFFNATDNQGHPLKQGPRGYAGNTLRAQATILVHETAHQITVFGFQHDNGIPKAGEANDKLVDQHCRQLIEGLK